MPLDDTPNLHFKAHDQHARRRHRCRASRPSEQRRRLEVDPHTSLTRPYQGVAMRRRFLSTLMLFAMTAKAQNIVAVEISGAATAIHEGRGRNRLRPAHLAGLQSAIALSTPTCPSTLLRRPCTFLVLCCALKQRHRAGSHPRRRCDRRGRRRRAMMQLSHHGVHRCHP